MWAGTGNSFFFFLGGEFDFDLYFRGFLLVFLWTFFLLLLFTPAVRALAFAVSSPVSSTYVLHGLLLFFLSFDRPSKFKVAFFFFLIFITWFFFSPWFFGCSLFSSINSNAPAGLSSVPSVRPSVRPSVGLFAVSRPWPRRSCHVCVWRVGGWIWENVDLSVHIYIFTWVAIGHRTEVGTSPSPSPSSLSSPRRGRESSAASCSVV